MAFIYEEIKENDLEFIKTFSFTNPISGRPLEPMHWTVDRERDAFLIGLGGQGFYDAEIPMYYALVWKKKVIILETYNKGHGSRNSGIEKWWKITKIIAPEIFTQDHQTIINLIKDAIIANSNIYGIDCVKGVNFDYIALPSFVKVVNY